MDQIVAKLRKADVELGKGKKVREICKLLEVIDTRISQAVFKTETIFRCGRGVKKLSRARNAAKRRLPNV